MHWIIIFLLANFWTAVYSQTWIGTYNITSTCDAKTCCCVRHQVLITRSSPNFFGFNVTVEGYCFGLTSYYDDVADPNSYTITASISIITLTIQLSSDSSTLTISNSYSASCDAVAIRQAAIVATTTLQTTTLQTTTIQALIVQTTTLQTTIIQTTTVQTTTVQTTTLQTTTVHSNAVPQYVNIIMLCSVSLSFLW